MSNTKLFASILLVLAVLFAQVGSVAAASPTQDGTTTTTISGTITDIQVKTDANGETVVVVTVEGYQPITLTAQEAADNHLYDLDTQQLTAAKDDAVQDMVVDSADVIPAEPPQVHPISWLLAEFFSDGDAAVANQLAVAIDSFHNGDFEVNDEGETQVFGFGVIAQALWMSSDVNGGTADTDLAGQILIAKQTGDYDITLADGTSLFTDGDVPTNWGQFKQALKSFNTENDKHNLGVIVSGHGNSDTEDPAGQQDTEHGQGKVIKHKHNKGNHGHP
ncbi:MAG TPA: hypothetical protein VK206_06395 [Anaerolineales bacterium]|nr:hypothetical protein [Anaerolineales bacterium]